MRKTFALCLAGLMLVSFAACKKEEAPAQQQPVVEPAVAAPADANAPAAADPNAPAADPNAAAPAADPNAPADPNAAAADPNAPAQLDQAQLEEIMKQIQAEQPPQVPAPEDVAAAPDDAIKTASGLAYKKLTTNEAGKAIAIDDLVKLHYTGWTTDGKMFDTSTGNPDPVIFTPNNLIDGMKEALVLAKTGEKMRVWIPQDLAYKGRPGAPEGMLVFEFDIQDVISPVMPPKDIPEDATKLENGIAYKIVKTEPGAKQLAESDLVAIDFSGWKQSDGKRFQSSIEIGEELKAPVNSMFPGWKAVLPNAHVGDVVQMWIPQEFGIDPEGTELAGMLIFEVTVKDAIAMPQPPADVAAPGPDTQKTESGIAYRILTPGTGTQHPTAESRVKVHYSGWTTDGVMFDSSVARGEPIEFALNQVIPGWTEAVQLMVPGEKRIVWIPEELAYKGQPGAPAGMLVFEIELLEIH
ncbi:MAG: FKBP-type peptidyl-prolyl cis-trans isomerase [Proteobacteria bacterium]|nr:FKBP-type peptidyl-prolyl cis-trans isomerase [Pseudomonadota bacterium]